MGTLFWILIVLGGPAQDPFAHERDRMVEEQIEDRGIESEATLRALRSVPRHLFVPANVRSHAYDDRPLPIGFGQTISQPYIVAYMTHLVQPKKGQRVLEVGTGSGYQAAVLSEIVDSVYTIEIIEELAGSARDRLRELDYGNVVVRNADGYHGWPGHAPFDAIVVTAAAEFVPPPLIEQLKDGGRMIIPVGMPFFVQTLMLVQKRDGKITTESLIPVRFVPLTGEGRGSDE
jgi:protein-L-isoaspartate(D-aspartate) O-methyltransferase